MNKTHQAPADKKRRLRGFNFENVASTLHPRSKNNNKRRRKKKEKKKKKKEKKKRKTGKMPGGDTKSTS